jgi:hypothetical protein
MYWPENPLSDWTQLRPAKIETYPISDCPRKRGAWKGWISRDAFTHLSIPSRSLPSDQDARRKAKLPSKLYVPAFEAHCKHLVALVAEFVSIGPTHMEIQ